MDKTVFYRQFSSPLGKLLLTSDGQSLTGLFMTKLADGSAPEITSNWRQDDAPFRAACTQLTAYFEGETESFDLDMTLAGTPFQKRVWQELCNISYGCAISYAELARRIGQPGSSRAVGGANGRNPISIIVPCHRVIGADGGLGGYGGGLDRKRWLLEHEAEVLVRHPQWRHPLFTGAITPRLLEV
ncbi:MAG: methylated-DNA--[protein]-cysteine S-methyltransferase [Isosphaeraceae bacterium]